MDLRNIDKFFTDRLREVPRNVRASIPKPVDYFDPAKGARIVSSAKPLMSPNLARAVASTSMLGNIAGRAATPFALISEAQNVFNPKDNIITALQNFGTSIENRSAAPGQERRYVGSNPLAVRANRALDTAKTPQNTGMYGRYIPGSDQVSINQTSYLPPEERNYQQEVSRTAQLTAQDPELQRYADAREKAAAQGFTPESVKTAEDIGMQIWAKKYGGPGGLASKVKPGQAGYEAIQGVLAPGRGMPGSTSLYKGAFPGDDYRDYGEPPTGAAAIPGFNTPAITGVAAQTVVPQPDPAQMKAQDLVESFKQGVFYPDLMEQIASSIYNR